MADQEYLIEYYTPAGPSVEIESAVRPFPSVSALRSWMETEVFNQRRTGVITITARQVSPATHEAYLSGVSRVAPNG